METVEVLTTGGVVKCTGEQDGSEFQITVEIKEV